MKSLGVRVVCAAVSMGLCAVVLAGPHGPVPVTHPGWKYGRDHCARFSVSPVDTHQGCINCCRRGLQDGHLTPATVDGCYTFCDVHWGVSNG